MSDESIFNEIAEELNAAAQNLVDACVEAFLKGYDNNEYPEKMSHLRGQITIAKGLQATVMTNTRKMQLEQSRWNR